MIDQWLKADSQQVLGYNFGNLPLFKTGGPGGTAVADRHADGTRPPVPSPAEAPHRRLDLVGRGFFRPWPKKPPLGRACAW